MIELIKEYFIIKLIAAGVGVFLIWCCEIGVITFIHPMAIMLIVIIGTATGLFIWDKRKDTI
jgi:hypothetical protein